MDRFMRAANLKKSAEVLYKNASPRMKAFFEVYARGVNAYLFRYRDKLPMDLAEAGYHPSYWKSEDSVMIFCLLNFGLSVNLQEEIAALSLTQKVGADKLAWLLPTYPDEPLPFEEADKLKGLSLGGNIAGLQAVKSAAAQVSEQHMLGVAASNNWAIAPSRSRSGKSLLANDMHLPIGLPSVWSFVQIRAPKFQASGVTVAGMPAVVAGFNGKLAWGMTMVMGDNQDLFLEKVKREGNRLLYLADGKWVPAQERQETFFIKGQKSIRETVYETRHGPLLNSVLGERKHPLQPLQLQSGYGLALKTAQFEEDASLDAFFNLSRAQSVEQAFEATREIRAMPLNLGYSPTPATSAGRSPGASPIAVKARAWCPHPAGTAATSGTASPTRCSTPTTRTRSRAGWAAPTSAACRAATACSCPTPGTRQSATSVSPSWQAAVVTTRQA